MSEVSIEIYEDVHKKSVTDLILRIQTDEFKIPITLELQPDLNEIPKFYQVNNGNFWIAQADGKVVGTIALLDIGNNQGALRKMFVSGNYRGKEFGVGQALLHTLIDWAVQKRIAEIFLGTTEKFLRAQRFYEKHGFVEIESKELPKTFPIMDVDVKFYRFSIHAT